MDKKTLPLILLLVVLIFFFWPIMEFLGFIKPAPEQPIQLPDTTQVTPADTVVVRDTTTPVQAALDTVTPSDTTAELPAETPVSADTIFVTTQTYEIALSTFGGGPISILLREHTYRNGEPIDMLAGPAPATPELQFANATANSSRMQFQSSVPAGRYDATSQPLDVAFTYTGSGFGQLIKRYRFYPDRYDFDLIVEVPDLRPLGWERQYNLVWNHPLDATEPDSASDYESMEAIAMMSGSREVLGDYQDDKLQQSLTGNTQWAGVRAKYFAAVMIPRSRAADGVFANGFRRDIQTAQGKVQERRVTVGLELPFGGEATVTDSFTVFVGPLDYTLLASYGVELEDMLGIGTTPFVGWLIKPFAMAIIWLLPKMYDVIPNYGLVILLFALLVKLVTLPLSMKSFKSMQAMKDIQPKVEELRKRHKSNPQQLNVEMMKLYKEAGVNPFSGCVPMLLQMPLFFALFSVFRSTILLRDAPFVWFINDLSRGATGVTDPYIVLVILMVVFQFISQKLTMATNQQNKMLMYFLPLMFAFFFYKLAAGLVLYWAAFSLFSLLDYFLFKRTRKHPEIKTA